ncbi:hypothetical protein GmHk_13G036297 [Glycine max]|nr:hypothetical protein GmHk_13G036297 [Glycine max]
MLFYKTLLVCFNLYKVFFPCDQKRLIRQVCEVLILICSLSQSACLASHPLSAPLLQLSVRKNLDEG